MEGSIRVLHVDDEPSFAEMVSAFLEREDDRFDVETATDAAEAASRLSESGFDCVVSDYDMPDADGIEFLERVRRTHPDLPFILFTGKGSEAVASDAISAGVTEYLQKQSGTEQYELLAHRIRNAVGSRQSVQRAETLDRVRSLVADVSGALIRATSRRDAETSVCEIISDADPYRFAWIGSRDPETDCIEPRASVGIQAGYLDEITVTADDSPTGRGPAGRAIRTRRIAVSQNVSEDPDFEQWRQAALERGFQSVAGVPLIHDDTVYGVLVVYADRTDAFDETERELLAELGDNVSHAVHSFRIQRERQRTTSLLSTLLDLLPVGVLAEDSERNVLAINRRMFELFGMSGTPEDAVGRDCERLARESADRFEDPDAFVERIDELIASGDAVDGETLRLADGRTFQRSYKPIELPDGDGHLWVYTDTTERERRTRQLEELTAHLESQYRYLFEQAPVMAVVTRERDGRPVVEECDRLFAETLGYDESEVVGRPLAEFYTPGSREELLEAGGYDRALDGEFDREYRELRTADGDVVETLLRAIPRRDVPGEVDGTLALYIDITERERLKREKDRLEAFADIVSHDLRNPLNVASGRLELARAERDDDHLEAVSAALDRMGDLIGDLLALAKGGEPLEATDRVDLAAAAETHWDNVETGAATLTIESGPTIEADRSRLGQLLENLFRNSVEHGSTSGRPQPDDSAEHGSTGNRAGGDDAVEHGDGSVTVTVGELDDGAGFYVADDGPGIPEADRESVFESGHTTGSGIGLGLAIVEEIATAHGWRVAVTESASGGARFEVTGVTSVE
jgi:PAS domain S-box-containing protein